MKVNCAIVVDTKMNEIDVAMLHLVIASDRLICVLSSACLIVI